MSGILDTVTQEYDAAVKKWRDKVAQFQQAFSEFLSNQADAVNLGLGDEWQSLYNRAIAIQNTLTSIGNGLSSIYGWVKDTFGFSGVGGLGVIPLIPIAVITGSIAALAYIISDLVKFNQKISLARSGNYSADQTNALLDSGGIISAPATKNILMSVIVGGAFLYFLPNMIKEFKKNGR